jgi:hypothetical protein
LRATRSPLEAFSVFAATLAAEGRDATGLFSTRRPI